MGLGQMGFVRNLGAAIHRMGHLPVGLHPALRIPLREHFGGHAALAPHPRPGGPRYLPPHTESGIWFMTSQQGFF